MFRTQSKTASSAVEEAAASKRLKAVMGRGKDEEAVYPVREEQPKTPSIRRRFWTPDELVETPH